MRTTTKLGSVLSRAGGLLALGGVLVLGAAESQAKLDPYFLVRSEAYGSVQPRILFLLDTSEEMTMRVLDPDLDCTVENCEGGSGQLLASRLDGARGAIRGIVQETGAIAEFALMTLDQYAPPTGSGDLPANCGNGGRFEWATEYDFSGVSIPLDPYLAGGMWVQCATVKRPYAYLRHDDLGHNSAIADDQVGNPPPSPLISTVAIDYQDANNAQRGIQWFPKFMGVRVNLNATTDSGSTISELTYGDYGNDTVTRDVEVRDHDFYYWPYVDGFPGYSGVDAAVDQGGGSWTYPSMGHVGSDSLVLGATLYAPFYSQSAVAAYAGLAEGPASEALAQWGVRSAAADMPWGGVDGGTKDRPWASAIGTSGGAPPTSNAVHSQTNVAEYLDLINGLGVDDTCVPHAVVVIAHDEGAPVGETGATLHSRLADLRTDHGAKTYVVAYDTPVAKQDALNEMACAAAGSDNDITPCTGTSQASWDTCDVKGDSANCAYDAADASELTAALRAIVRDTLDAEVPTGPVSSVHEFIEDPGDSTKKIAVTTHVRGYTEWPSYEGHVTRGDCTAASCVVDPPVTDELETFGPCPLSRNWDAGSCLQQTAAFDRRLYTTDSANAIVEVATAGGAATAEFLAVLNDPAFALTGAPFTQAQADEVAAYIHGSNFNGGWKLPGLANSNPVILRRIPEPDADFSPSVALRDPHCSGKAVNPNDAVVHPTLRKFASDAWDLISGTFADHYEYQEAVLVGDDIGVLHAFQLDSGNELFGYIPPFLLENAYQQTLTGPATFGQPNDPAEHRFGVANSVNHGIVWDATLDGWRHVGVFGLGKGGTEYVALDLSHMARLDIDQPFDLLWTTEDPLLKVFYDNHLGETWSRPALTYSHDAAGPDYDLTAVNAQPDSFVVFGSGYQVDPVVDAGEGRTVVLAEALTGTVVEEAELPLPVDTNKMYESGFGAVTDPAVGTHCLSGFWSEMQEAYITDPAGGLFRWDLGNRGDVDDHIADSGATWGNPGTAVELARFDACQGTGATCTVTGGMHDNFTFSPAVISSNRIDDALFGTPDPFTPDGDRDQFLLALASGSPIDDSIDGGDAANDFHTSLYLLVDDHRNPNESAGINVPAGSPKADAGVYADYVRYAISDLSRTRCVQFPADGDGAPLDCTDVRNFNKTARVVRPPRITTTIAADLTDPGNPIVIEEVEVHFIEFTIYEPGDPGCDVRWKDLETGDYVFDRGSTYTITFRLTEDSTNGLNFLVGAVAGGGDFTGTVDGFTGAALTAPKVVQSMDDCPGGNCGVQPGKPKTAACDDNTYGGSTGNGFAIPVTVGEVAGFTPVE